MQPVNPYWRRRKADALVYDKLIPPHEDHRDPVTGVAETEWRRRERVAREERTWGNVQSDRRLSYRFFYTDKSDITFMFPSDLEARRHATTDSEVASVRTREGRVVFRNPNYVSPNVNQPEDCPEWITGTDVKLSLIKLGDTVVAGWGQKKLTGRKIYKVRRSRDGRFYVTQKDRKVFLDSRLWLEDEDTIVGLRRIRRRK